MKTNFLLLALLMHYSIFGQGCTIDYNQTTVGIYPSILPSASVGQPYSTDVTFVLPTDTLGYPFTNFQITSITLPLGLNWTCSEAQNNCNYNPQFDVFGCINISGTPLLAGTFQISVMVLADLTILQGYPYQFQLDFQVNSPTIINNSGAFTYQVSQPCAPALVSFNNLQPGLAYYAWDFGNGSTSNSQDPNPQYFATAGSYPLHYEAYAALDTTIHIQLTQLDIQSMSNYGENFPSFEEADAYFKIMKNGQLIYQSVVVIDQNPPVSWWPNLDLELGQDYIIEIWEADQSIGESYFGADDYIGNHTINIGSCNACVAGNAQIAYQITIENINPTPSFIESDTLLLYESPITPIIVNDSLQGQLFASNTSSFTQWYFNDTPLFGQNSNLLQVLQTGYYHLLSINEQGCFQSSDTLFIEMNTANLQTVNSDEFKISLDQNAQTINIELHESLVGADFSILHLDGRLVSRWKSEQTKEMHSIAGLSQGIYIVHCTKGGQQHEQRFAYFNN
jgi:hypothetical protein